VEFYLLRNTFSFKAYRKIYCCSAMETHRSETFTAFRRGIKALPFPLQFKQIQNKTLQQNNAEPNSFKNQESLSKCSSHQY